MGMATFIAKRALILTLTLMFSVYMTVVIANFGGYVDKLLRDQITFDVTTALSRDPNFAKLSQEERQKLIEQRIEARIRAAGLDKPFLERSLIQFTQALTLNLGRAAFLRSSSGSKAIADIIMERLPRTVLLFTLGTIMAAGIGIFLGLVQARKALSKFDRIMIVLEIFTYVQPAWFYGILFILIFAFYLRIFPSGGMVSIPAPTEPVAYFLDVLYHLALPLITWIFASFGYWAYTTRNIVLQTMEEDFVTAARAKGLPERIILWRYVLRPSSPPIITGVAFAIVFSWTGAIITETVFNWPGIGLLFWEAIAALDAPVIIGLTVILAYLIVLTVLALDIIYGILDPRLRVMR